MKGTRVSDRFLWVNGQYADREEPALRADDRGLLYGDGFFDTLRVYGGVPFRLGQHLERLRRSCTHFGIQVALDEGHVCGVLGELLSRNGLTDAYFRTTVTRGVHTGEPGLPASEASTVVMEVRPLVTPPEELYRRGLRLRVSSVRLDPEHPLAGHKSLNYLSFLLARAEARREGADEALLLDVGGRVAEAATSNISCVRGGKLVTPTLSSGALPGITRQVVLELCQAAGIAQAERPLMLSELAKSDEVFLTNSLIEIMPVAALEQHHLAGPVPGPVTRRLQDLYRQLVGRETGRGRGTPGPQAGD